MSTILDEAATWGEGLARYRKLCLFFSILILLYVPFHKFPYIFSIADILYLLTVCLSFNQLPSGGEKIYKD